MLHPVHALILHSAHIAFIISGHGPGYSVRYINRHTVNINLENWGGGGTYSFSTVELLMTDTGQCWIP